jgi:hypothetical protein
VNLQNEVLAVLQQHGFTEQGGQWRGNNPLRPGSDSKSCVVTFDGDGGAWFDHVTEQGGSLLQLARELGIATEQHRAPVASTKRAYSGIADYAAVHGLDAATLEAYGWREHEQRGRKCLAFKTDTGWRYRFLDGKSPHYISEKGYKRCWYGLGGNWIGRVAGGQPAVLVNGEVSTVAAHTYGMAGFCMTSGEKTSIPDNLLDELKQWFTGMMDREIIIALDCDSKGRKAALGIEKQLKEHGFNVRAVDLQLGDAGDVADFCMLHGHDAAAEITKLPNIVSETVSEQNLPVKGVPRDKIIAAGRSWMMMHASDRHLIPHVEWVIPGEVPARALTVVYGPSGVGKSFYVIDMALRLAQDAPVVYMALEGEGGVPSRIDAWCQHHNKQAGDLILSLGTITFFDDDDLQGFIDGCKAVKPRVVIVDTLVRSMSGADENSTREMNEYTNRCKQIINALDCAVVLVHHTGKDGDRYRGSSVLKSNADSMIALIDDDDFIQVKCEKTKDAKPFATRDMTLLPVDVGVVDAHGNHLETPVMVPAERDLSKEILELTIQQREVLQTMSESAFEHGCSPSELEGVVHGVSRRNLYKVLSRLKDAGFVAQPAARKPYTLTNKGRDMLGLPPRSVQSVDSVQSADVHNPNGTTKGTSVNSRTLDTLDTMDTMFTDDELAAALSPQQKLNGTNYGQGA